MATPLLATKLVIPSLRPRSVNRPRLLARLDPGPDPERRLTLVSAAAGYGKTTLIAAWAAASSHPVAWLSLDEDDDSPIQFFRYLVAALQSVEGSLGRDSQALLEVAPMRPPRGWMIALINELATFTAPIALVLDDFHAISAAAILDAVQLLIEQPLPNLHVIISTRHDPPLRLARLRARGQLAEIRERDLRFSAEETATFLGQTMRLPLTARGASVLEARTEGWIAGLQLAALALHHGEGDAESLAVAFGGDHGYVTEYLVGEVLAHQPEPVRDFLRQTSILDRFSAALGDALTGQDNSQAMLDYLHRANLFLLPLDPQWTWFRYHQLFAEALRATLDPREQASLHSRAADWHEAHGHLSEAIHHALAAAAPSGDYTTAQRLIRAAADEVLLRGDVPTVRAWLAGLPDRCVRGDPALATLRAWVLTLSGEIALATDYLAEAEGCLAERDAGGAIALKILLLRAFLALARRAYDEVINCATRVLQAPGEELPRWRLAALWALAEARERTGAIPEAITAFRQAQRAGQRLGNRAFTATIEASLAAGLNEHGRRRAAVAVSEGALRRHRGADGGPTLEAGVIFGRLGALLYEEGDLSRAGNYVDRGLALAGALALPALLSFCLGIRALILRARGEADAATATLRQASQLVTEEGLDDGDWIRAQEIDFALARGDTSPPCFWDERTNPVDDNPLQNLRVPVYLTCARLMLAQDRPTDALDWLARVEAFTQARGLRRRLITIQILQSLAWDRSGDRSVAVDTLARAIRLAAPEDYRRAFLDEDPRIVTLLPHVRPIAPAFVVELQRAAGIPIRTPSSAAQPLAEPLSERELEVLGLVASGLSNAEIAARLIIAPGTVKRHLEHLYGKLDVASRTQAVAQARALGIL